MICFRVLAADSNRSSDYFFDGTKEDLEHYVLAQMTFPALAKRVHYPNVVDYYKVYINSKAALSIEVYDD